MCWFIFIHLQHNGVFLDTDQAELALEKFLQFIYLMYIYHKDLTWQEMH